MNFPQVGSFTSHLPKEIAPFAWLIGFYGLFPRFLRPIIKVIIFDGCVIKHLYYSSIFSRNNFRLMIFVINESMTFRLSHSLSWVVPPCG